MLHFCLALACDKQAQASASEQAMLQQQLEPLMRVAKAHAKGPEEYMRSIVHVSGSWGPQAAHLCVCSALALGVPWPVASALA